jgi:voltage-gated sodium channel
MQRFCHNVTHSRWFQRFVLGLILIAGVLVGVETNPEVMRRHGDLLHALDRVILALFTLELLLRIGAEGSRPWRFFKDSWNVFDFVIVAICLLPFHAQFAAVLRLARVLRVLRLVTAVPKLQILVGALLKSVPSMGYVALLLALLFYVYAVVGVSFFGPHDAAHFGSIGAAMLTLFQIVTLEGWVDIMLPLISQTGSGALPIIYFVSFILVGTMIMLNLLIGVIVNGMDEARDEMEDAARTRHLERTGAPTIQDDLVALERQLAEAQEALSSIQHRLKKKD